MKGISRNQKIVEILESLKETEKSYPPELMQARRQLFAKYVMSLDFEKPKGGKQTHSGNAIHAPRRESALI